MERIECPYEQLLREAGYVQIYDGQTAPHNRQEQFVVKPEDRRYFTRHFRQVKGNRFVDKWATLRYDTREGFCVDVKMVRKAPGVPKEEFTLVSKAITT